MSLRSFLGFKEEEPVSLFPDRTEYPAIFDRVLAETPERPKVELPSLSSGGCPKCGVTAVTTEYHAGVHERCPDQRMEYPGYLGFAYLSNETLAQTQAIIQRQSEAAIEHHDRSCCNCKYRWAEATISTPDPTP